MERTTRRRYHPISFIEVFRMSLSFLPLCWIRFREPEPNLIWGDVCHKGLELLIEKKWERTEFTPEDWEEIYGGVEEHIKSDWPGAPITFLPSIKQMLTLYNDEYKQTYGEFITENKFQIEHTTPNGNLVSLRGKADGWNQEHKVLVEHKCKGKIDIQQTMRETPTDLQVNVYSYVLGTRTINGLYHLRDNMRIQSVT